MAKRKQSRAPAGPHGSAPRKSAQGGLHNPRKGLVGTWLFGLHAVSAALGNPRRKCHRLLTTAKAASQVPTDSPLKPEIVDAATLSARLPAGAVHQGMALLANPLPELSIEDACRPTAPDAVVVVLDQVTDPHNVGAILRSAAAFGAKAVVVTERRAPAATGTLAKAASGALEVVPIVTVTNLARALDQLAELGYWRVGLDERAVTSAAEAPLDGALALVLGAEGEGLRRLTRQKCDHLIRLPTQGPIASLNVSNAAAVALYAIRLAAARGGREVPGKKNPPTSPREG